MAYQDPVKRAQKELEEMMGAAAPGDQSGNTAGDSASGESGTPTGDTTTTTDVNTGNQQQVQQTTQHAADSDPNSDNWKRRYEILQGKYNAEVPRLASELAQLKQQMAIMSTAQQQPKREVPDQSGQSTGDSGQQSDRVAYRSEYVDDEIRASRVYKSLAKEFGVDYAENHFEAAALAARSVTKPLVERDAQSARDRLHAAISAKVPDWLTTNDDPLFTDWAQNTQERFSRESILTILRNAYAQGDADTVSAIFQEYYQTRNTNQQTRQSQQADDVNALISPNRRGSSTQSAVDSSKGKVWTEAEIEDFYDACARGRYDNRRKEMQEIELDINKAYREGRVR